MDWKGRHKWLVRTRKLRAPIDIQQLTKPDRSEFPVYPLLWHPCRTRRTTETDPHGRLVGVEYQFDYQPSEPEFQAELGPNDVVWIPLYKGTINDPPTGQDEPREESDRNLDAAAEIGPRVRALLIGNANGEINYRTSREEEWRRAIEFIGHHSDLLGGRARLAFAPIFELLLHDCYIGGGKLRDAISRHNSLLVAFNGCGWLFENPHPKIPEPVPFPQLAEYIGSMEAWSGVGLQRGLDRGSDRLLKSMGFSAGIMGYF